MKNDETYEALTIVSTEPTDERSLVQDIPNIVTTEDEIECYFIIKSILHNIIDLGRISYKDTASYFSIILDGKVTKWLCRIYLKENVKYILIPDNETNQKIVIDNLDDIYNYTDQLTNRLEFLIK